MTTFSYLNIFSQEEQRGIFGWVFFFFCNSKACNTIFRKQERWNIANKEKSKNINRTVMYHIVSLKTWEITY